VSRDFEKALAVVIVVGGDGVHEVAMEELRNNLTRGSPLPPLVIVAAIISLLKSMSSSSDDKGTTIIT
jgi:hypothetical protein